MILLLLAHLSMVYAGWAAARYDAVIALLFLLTAGPALSMVRHGPVSRLTIPAWGFAGPAGDEQAADGRVRYAADADSPLS
jgi:hypothetical protein